MPEITGRKRLSREESRAQTRERVLDAAFSVFVRDGVEAASIEEITESAGYSRGAFYSNFESKEHLLCAVLEREIEHGQAEIAAMVTGSPDPEELIRKVRDYYVGAAAGDQPHCMFWIAVQLYALRNPAIRPRVAELMKKDRNHVVAQVHNVFAQLGKKPPLPPEVIALGLISVAQGLTLSQALDPLVFPPELLKQTLTTLFDRIAGLDHPT